MSDVFLSISNWIQAHQPLVVAVGVPFLTALAAGTVSFFTTRMNLRAQELDRELQKKLWVLEDHKKELLRLSEFFEEFLVITLKLGSREVNKSRERKKYNEYEQSQFERMHELVGKSQFITNLRDPEMPKAVKAMWHELELLGAKQSGEEVEPVPPHERLAAVSQRIVHRLRDQLYQEAVQ